MLRRKSKSINLALQGGGAHGAFTWGVLDRLLEDESLEIGWISGTSAGAINAAALASGLATGGRQGARDTLGQLWQAVERAGVPDFLKLVPFFGGLARSTPIPDMSSVLSPYDFNPLDINPLRRLLDQTISFADINTSPGPELLIAATDVSTGRRRLFRRAELTVEMLLASACLPTLHKAIEIDGRAYWDGGFSANPDLVTLITGSKVRDTLIVQLNALERAGVPRSARDIADQVNTITFNQPLLREVELIVAARAQQGGWMRGGGPDAPGRRLAKARFHLIEAGRFTAGLGAESKLKPDKSLLDYLFSSGRLEAGRWIEKHVADVGRRSTVDLSVKYLGAGPQPSLPLPEMHAEPGRATGTRNADGA